jgi:hypothetical protein
MPASTDRVTVAVPPMPPAAWKPTRLMPCTAPLVMTALLTMLSRSFALRAPLKALPAAPAMLAGQLGTIGWAAGVPPPAQTLKALAVLRGVGAPVLKSALLTSVSVQPPLARSTASEFDGAGVGPLPSKALAVVPKPTRSTVVAPVGVAVVVLLARMILPTVALRARLALLSGVGSATPAPLPAPSWTR